MPGTKPWQDDRVAWNKHWERENNAIYGSELTFRMTPGRQVFKLLDDLPTVFALMDAFLHNAQTIQSQVLTLQRDLGKKASARYAQDDFVHRWTDVCTPGEREKWMLEGLVRTCEASPDFEPHRRFCPELSMQRLNHRSGKGFLRLLEGLMATESDDDIKLIRNPIWDTMNDPGRRDEGKKVMARTNNVSRTSFMTYFVWNTLLAFVCSFTLSTASWV
jgi:hypothetical protein